MSFHDLYFDYTGSWQVDLNLLANIIFWIVVVFYCFCFLERVLFISIGEFKKSCGLSLVM